MTHLDDDDDNDDNSGNDDEDAIPFILLENESERKHPTLITYLSVSRGKRENRGEHSVARTLRDED